MDRTAGRVGTKKPHKLTGRVTAFVGRFGSGLEISTCVQLCLTALLMLIHLRDS